MAKRRPNGSGSITLRKDGLYMGRAYVLTDAGFKERVTVYGSSYEEVDAELAKLKANDRQGIPKVKATTRYGEYLDYWLTEVIAKERAQTTLEHYSSLVERHIKPALGGKELQKLSVNDVRTFLRSKIGSTTARKTEISEQSIKALHTCISSSLQNAVREELITRNVARLVQTPRAENAEVRPLTEDELAQFLTAVAPHRLRALWILYLGLGLRRCEGLGLSWDDIDFETGVVHVRYQLKRVNGKGLVRVRLKSKKSRRILPLPTVCARALRAWKLTQQADAEEAEARWEGNTQDLVFTTRFGRPIEPSNINRALTSLARQSQLRSVHPHALRHSCATFLQAQGVDMWVIRDILGHSKLSITSDLYSHVLLPALRDAIKRMDKLMGGDES